MKNSVKAFLFVAILVSVAQPVNGQSLETIARFLANANSINLSQTKKSTVPPAYIEDKLLPPQIDVELKVRDKIYTNPNKELLQKLYGSDWQNSIYHRTRTELEGDSEFRKHLSKLQATRNNDVTVRVNYDSPVQPIPGETFQYFDKTANEWKRTEAKAGDTAGTIAQRLGTTRESFLNENKDRFNIWPHASWRKSLVNLSEARWETKDSLRGLIAHEVSHTVDGTSNYPFYYGVDGKHSTNEITNPRTAWIEGWAEYNQAIFDPNSKSSLIDPNKKLFSERPGPAGGSVYDSIDNPSYREYTSNEGTVATFLTALDGDGRYRQDVLDTFKGQNKNWKNNSLSNRTIESFGRSYINSDPRQLSRTMFALDAATRFTSTKDDLNRLSGMFGGHTYTNHRDQLIELNKQYNANNPSAQVLDFFNEFDTKNFPHDIETSAQRLGLEKPHEVVLVNGEKPKNPLDLLGQPTGFPPGGCQ